MAAHGGSGTTAGTMQTHWEHFAHGADVGVRGYGPTRAAAFEQAALALTGVVTDPARVAGTNAVPIACEAADDELLLARWLNAVASEMGQRHMLFGRYEVRLEGQRLRARAFGEPLSATRHAPRVEVKGATCTALRVGPEPQGGWVAQTVVDV
jgi:SHS2 domain-containing protein